ncbi:MAG: hypothetical protein AB1793_09435, partial [Candidatus Thermoplasmatota archaeon]
SLPHPLRYILAYDSAILGEVVGAFVGAVFQHLKWKAKDFLGLLAAEKNGATLAATRGPESALRVRRSCRRVLEEAQRGVRRLGVR